MSDVLFSTRLRTRLTAAGVTLGAAEVEMFGRFYALLARWNPRINLTALPLTDYPDVSLDRLLVEPAVAAGCIDAGPGRWIDLGSGGGSPAIPLKVLKPALDLIMVEGRERKCAFLREVTRQLELQAAAVICARFESLDELVQRETANLVTLRAVRVDAALVNLVDRLLAPSGRVLIFGSNAAQLPGLVEIHRMMLPGGSWLASYCREGSLTSTAPQHPPDVPRGTLLH